MTNPVAEEVTDSAPFSGSESTKPARAGALAAGGLLAALGVGACCVLPVALMSVGLGGAWLSSLFALAPYQPLFIVLSVGLLAAGFYTAYRRPRAACKADTVCAAPAAGRGVKILLWGAAVLTLAGIAFPYLGQYLLEI